MTVLPQNTQNGLTPDTEHTENFRKAWGSDFSVFSVPRSGFSVFSVQKRLARWEGFTTEHTEGVGVVTT